MLSSGVRLAISKVALANNLDPAKLAAIVETESAGVIFWKINGEDKPTILTEALYFYRLTSGETRAKAVEAGLASAKWMAIPYPRTARDTYSRYERMAAIDPVAAMSSCSWGVGQVMGNKWKAMGYGSPDEFIAAQNTLEGQLDALVRELDLDKLRPALARAGLTADSWRPFARGYNGAAYARLNYHGKIAAAYNRYVHATFDEGVAEVSQSVKLIQKDLQDAGYWKTPIDGVDTPELSAAVKQFQHDNGLNDDGLYGPLTDVKLHDVVAAKSRHSMSLKATAGSIAMAAGAAGKQVVDAVTPLQASVSIHSLQFALTVILLIGIGLTAYGVYGKVMHDAETRAIADEKDTAAAKP